jgi:type III pantothenate kinase
MNSIVINIGNSNIRFGLFNDDNCDISWVINTKPYRTADELYVQMVMLYQTYKIEPKEISKVIIGSVVPQLTKVMSAAIKKIHDITPVIVDRSTPSGVQAKSKQMGTDIYANLVAAHSIRQKKNHSGFRNCTYCKLCCRRWRNIGSNYCSGNCYFS